MLFIITSGQRHTWHKWRFSFSSYSNVSYGHVFKCLLICTLNIFLYFTQHYLIIFNHLGILRFDIFVKPGYSYSVRTYLHNVKLILLFTLCIFWDFLRKHIGLFNKVRRNTKTLKLDISKLLITEPYNSNVAEYSPSMSSDAYLALQLFPKIKADRQSSLIFLLKPYKHLF